MAYKFPPMITMFFVSPFMLAWRTRSMGIARQPDAPLVIGRFLTYFTFVLLAFAVLFAVSLGPLLRLLTPPELLGGGRNCARRGRDLGPLRLVTFMEFGLLYSQRTARLAVLKSSIAVIKVGASVVLISRFGLAGAAYSAALMELVSLFWVARLSQRAFPIRIEWTRLATLVISAFGVFLLVRWVETLPYGPVPWLAAQLEQVTRSWAGSEMPALFRRIHGIVLSKETAMAALLVNATLACGFALSILALGRDARRYVWALVRKPATLPGRAEA